MPFKLVIMEEGGDQNNLSFILVILCMICLVEPVYTDTYYGCRIDTWGGEGIGNKSSEASHGDKARIAQQIKCDNARCWKRTTIALMQRIN